MVYRWYFQMLSVSVCSLLAVFANRAYSRVMRMSLRQMRYWKVKR